MFEKQEIETLLQRWGAWAASNLGTGIKPLMMWQTADAKKSRPAMSDEEAEAFDPAVAFLRVVDKECFEVVRLHYMYRMSFNAIAKVKHKNVKDCFVQCMQGKCYIEGFLYGYAAAADKIMALYAKQEG